MIVSDFNEVDGQSVGTSKMTTYTAYKQNTTARLECFDIFTMFLKVNNRTQDYSLKCDRQELLVIREVLNKWHQDLKN